MPLNEVLELIGTAVGIATPIVGGIWYVLKLAKGSIDKQIKELQKHIDDFGSRVTAIENKHNKEQEDKVVISTQRAKEDGELKVALQKISSDIEHLRGAHAEIGVLQEYVADLRETVAGFGKDYVTRRECIEDRREMFNKIDDVKR